MNLRSAIASPSVTDPAGTVGVDMAVNPLTLGTRKLHSAVNLRFEEGVIKTRPGIRYRSLGVSGQFQGALHYNPSKGLSARPFAAQNSALIVAVAGKLFMAEATHGTLSCGQSMCGDYDFACKGPVNLFQAENWLVVQNKLSNTYFWEGYNCLTESPGMAGDLVDGDPATPSAEAPRFGKCWVTTTFLQFTVVDDATGIPIPGATVVIKVGARQDYAGNTNSAGEITFYPVVKNYTYSATRSGYVPSTPAAVAVGPNSSQNLEIRLMKDWPPDASYPAVLMLVLDQTGSIGIGGAQRGIEIIDNTDVQAIGYVTFGDVVVQQRAITTDLATVRAELVFAAANLYSPPFFGDYGDDIPENGVDALAAGLALLAAFTDLPDGDRALFMKTDTLGFKHEVNSPITVNAGLNALDFVWLEFGGETDGAESGLYATTFPETAVVSHSTFPLIVVP